MNTTEPNLKTYTTKGISYEQYLHDMDAIIREKSVDDDYLEYYVLNQQRMKRLSKKSFLSESQKERLNNLNEKVFLLIITEGWCGDAAQVIPVVEMIASTTPQLEIKIVYRDENESLMDQYLTNGARSIPMIIGVDSEGNEKFVWGPRPEFGNEILKSYKAGNLNSDEFKVNLQLAYNKDKGNSIIEELLNKLEI